MANKERENFLRNAILIVDHTKDALVSLVDLELSQKCLTFEQVINKYQHDIYHLCYSGTCCQCGPGYNPPRSRVIYPPQLDLILYKSSKLSTHISSRRCTEYCCSVAKPGVSTRILDITLARCLLSNFCSDVFWFSCLDFPKVTLESFLNQNKHTLYHLWQFNSTCCQCGKSYNFPSSKVALSPNEWKSIFVSSPSSTNRCSVGSICICSYTPTPGITTVTLHHQVSEIMLKYCCPLKYTVDALVHARNHDYGHAVDGKMSDKDFVKTAQILENGIMDIARICNREKEFQKRIVEAKEGAIDESLYKQYHDNLLRFLGHQEDIIKGISDIAPRLDKITGKLDSTRGKIAGKIPQMVEDSIREVTTNFENENARFEQRLYKQLDEIPTKVGKFTRQTDHTGKEIECHVREMTFVPTRAVIECIRNSDLYDVFIITGKRGTGKSRIGLEILKQFGEKYEGFQLIKLTNLLELNEILSSEQKYVILFDDVLRSDRDQREGQMLENAFDMLYAYSIRRNIKVIFTMRIFSQTFEYLLLSHRLCSDYYLIDLNSEEFRFSFDEKRLIFQNYCFRNNIDTKEDKNENYRDEDVLDKDTTVYLHPRTVSEIIKTDPYIGFPQACYMFATKRVFTRLGIQIFKHPSIQLIGEVENFRKRGRRNILDKQAYITLAYIFRQNDLDTTGVNMECANKVVSSCYNNPQEKITENELIATAEELDGQYLLYDSFRYTFIHQTILESVMISYYNEDPKFVLSVLSSQTIKELVRLQGYTGQEQEVYISIPTRLYSDLIQRITEILETEYNSDASNFIRDMCSAEYLRSNVSDFVKQLLQELCKIKEYHISLPSDKVVGYFPTAVLFYLIEMQCADENVKAVLEYIKEDRNGDVFHNNIDDFKTIIVMIFKSLCKSETCTSKLELLWDTIEYWEIECDLSQCIAITVQSKNDLTSQWIQRKMI